MKCGFCGYEFDASDAESACASCAMARGCHLVRCPRCGYEMPPEASLVIQAFEVISGGEVLGLDPDYYQLFAQAYGLSI